MNCDDKLRRWTVTNYEGELRQPTTAIAVHRLIRLVTNKRQSRRNAADDLVRVLLFEQRHGVILLMSSLLNLDRFLNLKIQNCCYPLESLFLQFLYFRSLLSHRSLSISFHLLALYLFVPFVERRFQIHSNLWQSTLESKSLDLRCKYALPVFALKLKPSLLDVYWQ